MESEWTNEWTDKAILSIILSSPASDGPLQQVYLIGVATGKESYNALPSPSLPVLDVFCLQV